MTIYFQRPSFRLDTDAVASHICQAVVEAAYGNIPNLYAELRKAISDETRSELSVDGRAWT